MNLRNQFLSNATPFANTRRVHPVRGLLNQGLTQLQHWLATAITLDQDPRVWTTIDRHGNQWWMIDDPMGDRTIRLGSETDARIWLDQRWNRGRTADKRMQDK